MTKTRNSFSSLLADLMKIQENSNDILAKISESLVTPEYFVEMEVSEIGSSTTRKVKIPSMTALIRRLEYLEKNIESLSSIDSSTSVVLPDGTLRTLILNKLSSGLESSQFAVPSSFEKKSNWFFDNLMSPALYVELPIPRGSVAAEVRKHIVNLDSEEKEATFSSRFKGLNDINYSDFLQFCLSEGIEFFEDSEIIKAKPKSSRFYGKFSVVRVFDEIETVNGKSERILKAVLDTLTYSDSESKFLNTRQLKIGNSLLVEDGIGSTRYEIVFLDESTNTIGLIKREGFSGISVGSDILSFYDTSIFSPTVEMTIGLNEVMVVFVKPIDSSNVVASNWGSGFCLYTEDLSRRDDLGNLQTLSEFYSQEVIDFGSYLYALAKDNIPPATLGLIPNVPVVVSENFKVVQINNHFNDQRSLSELNALVAEKNRLNSLLKDQDRSIREKRSKILSTSFKSKNIEDSEKTELDKLIKDRESTNSQLTSTVESINSIIGNDFELNYEPKYRLRGFWPIPEPILEARTGPQNVVQFELRYRYLSKTENPNEPQQFDFKGTDGKNRRGTIPVWNTLYTPPRKRIEDPETGKMVWETDNSENSEETSCNSCDIPISSGEIVEFQIRSLSEAGWPSNPKKSDWTSPIRISFPDDLAADNNLKSLSAEIAIERQNLFLNRSLETSGITEHVSDSFSTSSRDYLHTANNIFSGFYLNSNPMSLFEKLNEMDSELKRLKSIIEKAVGKLLVKIVDDKGNEFKISNNAKFPLFAGNYKDDVKNLTVKKGAIVTKTYFLKIENEAVSDLEMYARVYGSRLLKTKPSYNNLSSDFDSNDIDYNTIRRYDLVPISLRNPLSSEADSYDFINYAPFSSSQVKGSFVCVRYKSIDGIEDLVATFNSTTNLFVNPSGSDISTLEDCENLFDGIWTSLYPNGSAASDFIWKGTNNDVISTANALTILNTQPNSILIHKDHPFISEWNLNFSQNGFSSAANYAKEQVRVSKFSNLVSLTPNSKKVMGYSLLPNFNSTLRTPKLGFIEEDQYLIGPRSCGAYLFFAPNDHQSITVDGADSLSRKKISFGSSFAVSIPIIFQYRMTDYYGIGTSGIGKIAGDPTDSSTQLEYIKTIGIDIFSNENEKFSFDFEVTARYSSKSFDANELPNRTFEQSIDDLTRTIAPSITR